MAIDTDWFFQKIEESEHCTALVLAKKMTNRQGNKMDHTILSKLLNGQRKMSVDDAVQIANLLDLDVKDVIKKAGYKLKR